MDFRENEFSAVDSLNISSTAIILLNPQEGLFSNIFSKLEFLNAFGYLKWLSHQTGIPVIQVDVIPGINRLADYIILKERRSLQRVAPKSALDNGFVSRFNELVCDLKNKLIADSQDIFHSRAVEEELLSGKFDFFLIAGFLTDRAVLRVAFSSLDHGILPVIVSDATSTYSERIYYECLDVISQSAEVIDSRDLMRRWPDQ